MFSLAGIVPGDVLKVRTHEDQASSGAALAFGGGDAGLCAPDLAFEGFFPVTLGFCNTDRLRPRIHQRPGHRGAQVVALKEAMMGDCRANTSGGS